MDIHYWIMYLHKSIMNQSYYGSPNFSNSYGTPSFYFWISISRTMQLPMLKYGAPWFGIWRSIIYYGDPYTDCGYIYIYICLTIHGLLSIILDLINYLQWLYNEWDGVSNHRRLDCLFKRLFWRRSKKTSKLRVTGLCEGNHLWLVDSPHKGQ